MMKIDAFINPLTLIEMELSQISSEVPEPNAEAILHFLCQPGIPSDAVSLIQRYQEISSASARLSIVPAEQRILDKLIWPLRDAKTSYMLGNHISVIASCGLVAEMIAILHWKIANPQLNEHPMDDAAQKNIFGRTFEKLGQERRIEVLLAYGIIDDNTMAQFKKIKNIRRKYLHLWSQDHESLPTDAVETFQMAVKLVVGTIGQDFQDGKFVLNSKMVKYLEQK